MARLWEKTSELPAVGATPSGSSDAAPEGALTRRARFSPIVSSAVLGTIAMWSIMVGASLRSSPFTYHRAGSWFFGTGANTSHGMIVSVILVYGGLLLFLRVWFDIMRWLGDNPGYPVARLWAIFAVWVVPMLVVPPLFSRDVYSYAAQGEMVSHHISPYQYGPGALGYTQYLDSADPMWQNAPTPYGPLVLGLDGWIVQLTGHHVLASIVLLRVLALVGVLIGAAFVPQLARHYGRDGAETFAIAILSPVTLLHLVGGAHNDALMAGLLIAGLAVAKSGRPVAGIVLCTLAAAVKIPAELAVVYIGWEWLGSDRPWRERVRPLVTAGLVSAGVMALLSVVTRLGWGWIDAMGTPGTVVSIWSPTTQLGILMDHVQHFFGLGIGRPVLVSISRDIGLLMAVCACIALLATSRHFGTVRAISISLIFFVLLGPVVQPWYLSWGLLLAAPVATGKLRKAVIWLSAFACFMGLPGGHALLAFLRHQPLATLVGAVAVLLLVMTTPLRGWARRLLSLRPASVRPSSASR